ncbi:hypothetical protein [Streptomyces sp. NPDC003401]
MRTFVTVATGLPVSPSPVSSSPAPLTASADVRGADEDAAPGTVLLPEQPASPGPARALTGPSAPAAVPATARDATRAPVRLPYRLRPDEPGPSTPDSAGPRRTVRPERADDGLLRGDRPDAAPRAHDRTA